MADIEMSLGEDGAFSMFQPPDVIEQTALDYEREYGDDADFIRGLDSQLDESKKVFWVKEAAIIYKAHERLANNKNGTFTKWSANHGWNKQYTSTRIRYIDFIIRENMVRNPDHITGEEFKKLPSISVANEAMKANAPQSLIDGVKNGTITTVKAAKEERYGAKQTEESDEVKALRARAAQAEQERDEAKRKNAELDSIRANIMKQNADYAQENHKLKMDNNALAHENEQLHNQPQAEPEIRVVEKRVEVIPDEYKKALLENQQLKKELAAHRAHAQNMTVQELAQTDKEFDDLQKSYEEEERTSKRLEYFETLSSFFPEGQIEARELARCFLKFHGNEPAIVHTVQQNLRLAIDSMTWIYDALTAKPKLEVVK